ncbi:Thiamine-phosphate synthase [Caloramator mitchellensis]|uniref:Thiamine-phosphate synthase n=1 Tax=Caloramator mitchellensis TaxID=908809 RepID=A0A0R3K5I0_CALMK|nr:thiamine phosphate synthase [Caloramator mitchellensis]KRQ87631.1 Thiamine-phosphate synthase [Caloramator mitchellensis]
MKNVNYKLYLVTDRDVIGNRSFLECIEEALKGGVSILQLREKKISSLEFYDLALDAKKLTEKYDVPLIINDRVDIALAIDADGVHVGQEDLPVKVVRKIIGDAKILGVSVTNLEEAKRAIEDGADYLGVGAVFPTVTKKDANFTGIELLREIREKYSIPVVAIGGINEGNIEKLNGLCDGAAIISGILGQKDIKKAAEKINSKLIWIK